MQSARYLLIVAVVFATSFATIEAYGTGAPVEACAGARPNHITTNGSSVQPLDPANNPYSFTFDANINEYIPGQDLEVTISEANGGMINGFFLQAWRQDGVAVGTFREPLPDGAQFRECRNAADSVTHTHPNGKTGLTFTWRAPPAGSRDITFVGTVAIDHDNFYGRMTSAVIAEGSGTVTGEPMTTSNAFKLSSGFGIFLFATIVGMLQIFV